MKKPDYSNSILNVSNSILHFYNIKTIYNGIDILDKELKNNYNHIVLILLDGMGINIIKKHLSENDALRKNIKKEISSVFPPTTVAATNSVLSGFPPFVHGNLGWMQYNKFTDSYPIVFKNIDYYDESKILEEQFQKKYLNYKDIFAQIKDKQPDLMVTSIFPDFIEGGCASFTEEVDRVLSIVKNKKSFTYCYWTDPDATIHEKGVNSIETGVVMKKLNNEYERLLDNISNDVLVITIADHGLIDVEEINLFEYENITKYFKRKPALEPRATAFYIIDNEYENFEKEFNKTFGKYFLLFTKEEVLRSGLFGWGIKHELFDDFIGDYLAIAFSTKMFSLSVGSMFAAHHAGITEEELMVPLIINK
ncbi:MAG: alkaline phosphatase family protein [Bacilli bacterium]|jgi:predicted AlkP superfamily pyrophosphatase or phosphodiesterase|nr:alkaline phosphatase family protein [Bacilli bacterium]MDD2681890.1 alkaline phosphatase family protein [Bacilli bacterium]MDD3121164.1 alkaline phosphatase family protein [Bacilli bacterium]MDD4063340.1 alkaline phosphatase family protein [Bacilli bacterium]MDD4482605.1 alkaline phosphatase family protein [Bacilli bacterium]